MEKTHCGSTGYIIPHIKKKHVVCLASSVNTLRYELMLLPSNDGS